MYPYKPDMLELIVVLVPGVSDRYRSKPGDDYEDPKDVQAIKEAQVFMGDFNLKTAPDYKIPEHMRINAAKKEEELGQLDSMVLRL